jgi:hypothetical protein
MDISRPMMILMVIAACFSFGAGCTGPQDTSLQSAVETPVVTSPPASPTGTVVTTAALPPAFTPTTLPMQLNCPDRGNESPWIILDQPADLVRGEREMIGGETNVPAGDSIEIVVYESAFHPHCKCCYDDDIRVRAIVHEGPGCNNTFSYLLDSSNLRPQEYVLTARYGEDISHASGRIFSVFKNYTTPQIPAGALPANFTADSLLTLGPVRDEQRGVELVIDGYTGKPDRAILYSIRDLRYSAADCRYTCPGQVLAGTMYANVYGDIPQPFWIRMDTSDLSPGRYAVSLTSPCSGESAEKLFNIVS